MGCFRMQGNFVILVANLFIFVVEMFCIGVGSLVNLKIQLWYKGFHLIRVLSCR